MIVAAFVDGTVGSSALVIVASVAVAVSIGIGGTLARIGTTASSDAGISLNRVVVEVGDVERVAVVALLRLVSIRGREWLPRRIAVHTAHVGNRRACHAAGVEENANNRI
jgi:hypothetical protein